MLLYRMHLQISKHIEIRYELDICLECTYLVLVYAEKFLFPDPQEH